ncbi:MAG: hypothetical protein ACFFG0_04855 [Candidatus Thorarchaeota archaeon]
MKERDDIKILQILNKIFLGICYLFDWIEHRIWKEKEEQEK